MAQTPCKFVKEGEILDYIASSDKLAGEVVVVGTRPLIVVNAIDYSLNPLGAVYAHDTFDVPQNGEVIAAGTRVYWDADGNPYGGTAGSGCATATATGNNLMGTAVPLQPNGTAATAATDSYVRVDIDGTSLNIATVAGSMTADDIVGSDAALSIGGIPGSTGAGGTVVIVGGAGDGNAAGGLVSLTGGAGDGTGAGGAASVVGGLSGDGATGNGGAVSLTGGAAQSTAGNGGSVILTGGALAGTGVNGMIRNLSKVTELRTVTAQTTANTLTIAKLLTGIVTGTHTVGATAAYTLPTGTLCSAGCACGDGDGFYWHLINLSAAAADTLTVTAGTDHTIVGVALVESAHISTGGLSGSNSSTWFTRKTTANTWVTYRVG